MEVIEKPIEDLFVWAFANYHPMIVVTLGTFILHEVAYFGMFLPYWFIDTYVPSLHKYKIQKDKPNTFEIQWNCFWRVLVLHVTCDIPLMMMSHTAMTSVGMSVEPPFPKLSNVLPQIIVFFMVEDFYFYWVHRLLHWGPFYRYIHKVHHEHAAPFGMAGEYAHPIEEIFLGIGTGLGPFLLKAHLFTLWVWLLFRVWQVVDCHSGYNFPWSSNHWLPFWGGADFHDYHHMSFVGNYASTFTYCDKWFGTDTKYHIWKAKQLTDQVEEKKLQ